MKKTKAKALTLIELLIASAIFVIVMLTIYSSFHTGIFGYRNIEETINIYQTARQILERINIDLRNSFTYSVDESRFEGKNDKVSFLALVDSYQEDKIVSDYASVSYKLEGDRFMRLCRKNLESLNDKSQMQPEEMASNVEEIIFSYGYVAAVGEPIEWKDLWGDHKTLPVAIKVKLTLQNKTKQDFERTIFLPLAGIE